MTGGGRVSRRAVLLGLGALATLPSCASPFAGTRLAIATGSTQGVYYRLGSVLADIWQRELGLDSRPEVLSTAGSVDNLELLQDGRADIVFSQIDTADEQLRTMAGLRALARIYDDALHVIVRKDAPITSVAELRGARISVGAHESGVEVIAKRLLKIAAPALDAELVDLQLGLDESAAALADGQLDAFFWSGGVPTDGITDLAARVPIRLLDLNDVVDAMRTAYPVYQPGIVPAQTYHGMTEPVTTLVVRNVLLVDAALPDDLADRLTEVLFAAQEQLAQESRAAVTIDPQVAIGTQPVPLHPGADSFYRRMKRT